MTNKKFKKMVNKQRERILQKLDKTTPGTGAYRELQNQLTAFDLMEEKQSSGKVKATDWFKLGGSILTTALIVSADQWFPNLVGKLKLSEFVQRLGK